jgi:hypothetical protein
MLDIFRHRSRTGKSHCWTRSDVGSERVKIVLVLCMACSVSDCHLWPRWFLVCVFVGCILGNTTVIQEWNFYPSLYISLIYCVYGYLASEYLLLNLYNKSLVIEHHFTVCRLFVYCVCSLFWVHVSTTAGGSQSTGIVQQGAVTQIRPQMLAYYFFSGLYSLLA